MKHIKFNPPSAEKANYFYFIIVLGQFLGVLPLIREDVGKPMVLKFKAASLKVLYCAVHICCVMLMMMMCIFHTAKNGFHFGDMIRVLFYGTDFVSTSMFMVATTKWPDVYGEWRKLDKSMERKYGYPKRVGRFLKVVTCLAFLYSLGQVLLFLCYNTYRTMRVAERKGIEFSMKVYLKNVYPQVFNYFPYSLFLGLLCKVTYLFTCLRWMYTDVFLGLMSYILSLRFKQVSQRMKAGLLQKQEVNFWKEMREDYNKICFFCTYADNRVCDIVFSSFMTNLILMLVYLYNCTVVEDLNAQKVYNVTMLVVVTIRTTVVTIIIASVNVDSKVPAKILNSIATNQYNTEIQRMLRQISFDDIGFTAYKMFTASRDTVLSIAGVLLTYELILVQFIDLKLLGNQR